jgi:DNA-binding SARP family transcriptional activator
MFIYLAVRRVRAVSRDELGEAIWPDRAPAAEAAALDALVSKLRRALGPDAIEGRSELRLCLPADARVDLEAAREAVHRAESAVAQADWPRAWGAAQVTMFTARRGFLPGEDLRWAVDVQRELESLHLRALEAYGTACLGLGGTELAAAERVGREVIALAPYRESGHRLLIEGLAARGNRAEALRAYDDLRTLLREELGVAPGPQLQQLHAKLVRAR